MKITPMTTTTATAPSISQSTMGVLDMRAPAERRSSEESGSAKGNLAAWRGQ